jgi:hypothetical protein
LEGGVEPFVFKIGPVGIGEGVGDKAQEPGEPGCEMGEFPREVVVNLGGATIARHTGEDAGENEVEVDSVGWVAKGNAAGEVFGRVGGQGGWLEFLGVVRTNRNRLEATEDWVASVQRWFGGCVALPGKLA